MPLALWQLVLCLPRQGAENRKVLEPEAEHSLAGRTVEEVELRGKLAAEELQQVLRMAP